MDMMRLTLSLKTKVGALFSISAMALDKIAESHDLWLIWVNIGILFCCCFLLFCKQVKTGQFDLPSFDWGWIGNACHLKNLENQSNYFQ